MQDLVARGLLRTRRGEIEIADLFGLRRLTVSGLMSHTMET